MNLNISDLRRTTVYQELLNEISKNKINHVEDAPYILLDGLLPSSHNLFVHVVIGLAANEVLNLNVAFLTLTENEFVSDLANSLGFKVITYGKDFRKLGRLKKTNYYKDLFFHKRKIFNSKVLDTKIGTIPVGDLIYDTVIRKNEGVYTVDHFDKKKIETALTDAVFNFHAFIKVLKKIKIDYISLSHKVYTNFGVLARTATGNEIEFISKNRSHLKVINSFKDQYLNDYYIDDKLYGRIIDNISQKRADSYIVNRFNGKLIKDHNVKHAYTDKKFIDLLELEDILGIDLKKPIGAIVPHAFSDAPHSDGHMIYKDYYEWLISTLEIVKNIERINWIIKPHPGSFMYGENNVVNELIKDHNNIKLYPSDLKITSLFEISDATVTVRGTAGLECLLFDSQPILAGDAYYMDLGYTINCKTEDQYVKALQSIKKKVPIQKEIKDKVKKVLYWRRESYLFFSGIFGPECHPGMTKEEIYNHELSNYQHVYNFLKDNNYKDDPYYKLLIRFFKEGRKTLCACDFSEMNTVLDQ